MEPAINLYSSNEKSELIRENSQEILSVLAAHQIALWEYDIITGKCSFSNDYFFTLGLKDAGIIFEDIDDFYRFIHPEDIEFYKQAFAEMLSSDSKTSQIRVRCISEQGKVIWLEDHFLSYKESCESHPGKLLAYTVNVTSQCEKEQHIKYLEEYNRKIIEAFIIRKSKFPQNPKRSVRFSGKGTKRSVQKRKARNTQKAETKVL